MLKFDASLEEIEEKLISYDSFKQVLQQYMRRLLSSDQDTLAVVAEMLDAVKGISSARELADTPLDTQRLLEVREDGLERYGGVLHVLNSQVAPLLEGGTIKLDDPHVYGLSLICTWLDCIISNPEQSLDSLRKIFLRATDPWGADLNRTFHVDLGRVQPIADATTWLGSLLRGERANSLHLARVTNITQALGLEEPIALGRVPLPVWQKLLNSRPVYDLTTRYARAGQDTARARLIAVRREQDPIPCLYRLGLDPMPTIANRPVPITLGDLQTRLGCTLAAPVRLEVIERADHLGGSAPTTFSAFLPLGALPDTFARILNSPESIDLKDVTPPTSPLSQRLLRLSAAGKTQSVRLVRIHLLPPDQWPSGKGWTKVYRFSDLGDIGVATCPSGAYLEVSMNEDDELSVGSAEVSFYRWGSGEHSLRIMGSGLRRAAQTGTMIILHSNVEAALDILTSLQGLIGPAAQEIEPIISELECHVRWKPRLGAELFRES